jgi:DNA polymerase I-like protein with 3'-5' exonuclease and polymerase domains
VNYIEHKDGSGDPKTGSVVGGGAKDGKVLKNSFFKNVPALGKLITKIKGFVEKHGYIPSIDGRKIFIRKFEGRYLLHTALNALLQASGSIVVKYAIVLANKEIKKRRLDSYQVIFMHDEIQVSVLEEHADEVGQIVVDSFKASGIHFKLRIPLDGEYKKGNNWAETH